MHERAVELSLEDCSAPRHPPERFAIIAEILRVWLQPVACVRQLQHAWADPLSERSLRVPGSRLPESVAMGNCDLFEHRVGHVDAAHLLARDVVKSEA